MTAVTSPRRRPDRRQQLLDAAVVLFHERGYDATGIDDIGAAAGITGPAVYRHFRSEQEILETLLHDLATRTLEAVQAIAEDAESPAEALDALIAHYARTIIEHPSLAVVAMYERRTLSAETRALIDRLERLNIEEWVHVVSQVRPDLSDAEARASVHAVLSLGVAVCNYRSGLDDERLQALVANMIRAGLAPPRA
jgi:AcrR family transcriptional regulator